MGKRGMDVTMTLPGSLVRQLDRYAKVQGVSRSAAARDLLGFALRGSDDVVRVLANRKVREAFMRAATEPGVIRGFVAAMGHELTDRERQEVLRFFKASSEPAPFES